MERVGRGGSVGGRLCANVRRALFAVTIVALPGATVGVHAAALQASVAAVTSNSVGLSWSPAVSASIYLAPEPGSPERVLMAQGVIGSYTVSPLAPGVDCFLRIEAAGYDPSEVHARTLGGPRAALTTPVREVHGFAPNMLEVVVSNSGTVYGVGGITGNLGAAWQAGMWTVRRRNGSAIPVLKVHRHSIPVGQPSYALGVAAFNDINVVDVDHHLFLVLSEPIGSREVLDIQGPLGTSFRLPFSDRYLQTSVIQLNQVGYSPRASKRWAYVSGWMGDGGPLSLSNFPPAAEILTDTAVVATAPITPRWILDADAGGEVRQIDLSGVPRMEGVFFRIRIPGVGVSWPTQVSEIGLFKAFYVIARGLYHNRWGRNLQPQWTEWSARPPDHPTVYTAEEPDWTRFYPELTPWNGKRPLVGGHHDAGDFDIRPTHTVAGMLLLRAFEQRPDLFTDSQLTIPESGNGIPDLLDEALWSVAGWEYLQEADGGVRQGAESWRHPWGIYYADEDPLPYWTYARNANHTARVAGLFAQAASLVRPYNSAVSERLKGRAVSAWQWASANGASSGPKFYASGELYRLTGDAAYKSAYESLWAASPWGSAILTAVVLPWTSSYSLATQPIAIDYLLGYLGGEDPHLKIVYEALTHLSTRANEAVQAVESNHAHRNGRPSNVSPDWGMATAVGEHVIPVIQRLQYGGLSTTTWQAYVDALSISVDYALGANPHGMVWITRLGSRHPQEPLHLDALSFLKDGKGLLPGIPVYGPVKEPQKVYYYDPPLAAFYPPFTQQPLGRRFADCRSFVTTAEFDLGIQARQVELFASILGAATLPQTSWLPGGSEHKNSLAPAGQFQASVLITYNPPNPISVPEIELPALELPELELPIEVVLGDVGGDDGGGGGG
ncbi:glycoside hydrolase family 9 protein, partial [bacterium]|nr:glycoside hydrolase family 9 protein [bacterium]